MLISREDFLSTTLVIMDNWRWSSFFVPRWIVTWLLWWEVHLHSITMISVQGAKVDATDKHGITPILAAIWEGHTTCVKYLLDNVSRYFMRLLTEDFDFFFIIVFCHFFRVHQRQERLLMDPLMWRPQRKMISKCCWSKESRGQHVELSKFVIRD